MHDGNWGIDQTICTRQILEEKFNTRFSNGKLGIVVAAARVLQYLPELAAVFDWSSIVVTVRAISQSSLLSGPSDKHESVKL